MVERFVAVVLIALTGISVAGDIDWADWLVTGDWNDPASWDGNKVPEPADNAYFSAPSNIVATMGVNTNATINSLQLSGSLECLTLDFAPTALLLCSSGVTTVNGGRTLNLIGGGLSTIGVTVGSDVPGNTFAVSDGGTFMGCTSVTVGAGSATSSNTLMIVDSDVDLTKVTGDDFNMGFSGAYSTLALTNATLAVSNGVFRVGVNTSARHNDVLLNNSTLYAGNIRLGINGATNRLILTENSHVVVTTGSMIQGESSNSSGSETLLSASTLTARVLNIGNNGFGNTFTLRDASTLSITDTLTVGDNGGVGNTLIISDNSKLTHCTSLRVGANSTTRNSTIVILDSDVELPDLGPDRFNMGINGSYSTFAMTNASLIATNNGGVFRVGVEQRGHNNYVLLSNSTLNVTHVRFGVHSSTNYFILADNAKVTTGSFRMSEGEASSNNVLMVCGTNVLVKANEFQLYRDTAIKLEVPTQGFAQAPIHGNNFAMGPDITLTVEAKAFSLKGGGRVPLIYSANKSGLVYFKDTASFATIEGRFEVEENDTLLVAYIPDKAATLIMVK